MFKLDFLTSKVSELVDNLEILSQNIANASKIVILTGAGMSAESGIQTFRGAKGFWSKYNPMELASKEGFTKDPELVWKWYQERYNNVKNNNPHAGHFAITELQKIQSDLTVITQNVDGYHQQSGTKNVLELHGSIVKFKCLDCEKQHLDSIVPNDLNTCNHCNGLIRPDVIWFGEQLPYNTLKAAEEKALQCDLFISIGTSSEVYPAAGLPLLAKQEGATVIEINPNETALSNKADIVIRGLAKEVLPEVLKNVKNIS
jgi:NAD-dependent deacetylase